ncbi:MAG: tryptophan 2,3-dioxygenase, partial [Planctomycetota bacterium]
QRCIDHFEVMETLTTREYLAFRDKLTGASGFQSAQMRQMEILLGLKDGERISLGAGESYLQALREADGSASDALQRVQKQIEDQPSIKEVIDEWLYRTPIDGCGPDDVDDEAAVARFIEEYAAAHAKEVDHACAISLARTAVEFDNDLVKERYESEKQALLDWLAPSDEEGGAIRRRTRAAILFIISYRELPLLSWPRELLDSIIEMEQHFTIFRQRHARMVERIIGRRTGTGGSAGVDYLDQTALTYRIFKDLWTVRTFQLREEAIPKLHKEEFYDFRAQ